jgi:organic radical activating enzyme
MLKYYTTGDSDKLLKKYIIIPVTNVCNLSCGGCNQLCGNYPKEKLWFIGLDELRRNIDIASKEMGKKNIGLFGGEPTLHPEFQGILELCYTYPDRTFMIYTNGRVPVSNHRNVVYNVSPKCDPVLGPQMLASIKHYPTLVAARDVFKVEDRDFYWEKAKRDCCMWNDCGTIIYKDQAYYCEIAGAMDQLTGERNGWPVREGENPFRRTDAEIREQARKFCYRCGWCLAKHYKLENMPAGIPEQRLEAPYLVTETALAMLPKPKKHLLQVIQPGR